MTKYRVFCVASLLPVVVAGTGNDLPASVDIQPLHGELLLVLSHHAQEPVRKQMHRP